jgi:PadR family transcriptional regulator PadR
MAPKPPRPHDTTGGLPRNYLRPVLLQLLSEGRAHGYDLLEQMQPLGLDHTDTGGLYRCLRAMEQEGLVRSWWEPSHSGPPRRTYALTDDGLDWLHAWAGALRIAHQRVQRFLDRYETAHAPTGTGR